MADRIEKTDAEWAQSLTPEQYRVMREKGTERAFTGKYWNAKDDGVYHCAACGAPLFDAQTKFDSGTGWPSFTAPIAPSSVETETDTSHGMKRVEVHCARCAAHLGHLFDDGPAERGGKRYCINGCALTLEKKDGDS